MVRDGEARQRLDAYLAPRLPLLSGTKLRVLFAQGGVLRNGLRATGGEVPKPLDTIAIHWDPARLPPVLPEPYPLELPWEDVQICAVNKPAGMLMHPTVGVKRGTLTNAMLALWNPWLHEGLLVNEDATPVVWPRFVHRLDRDTSGVVLVARDAGTASRLGKQWAARGVAKQYLAIMEGTLKPGMLEVDEPIARVAETKPHWQVSPDGAPALSRLRALAWQTGRTLAMLEPVTGRTNQLRIHAARLGHPIVGDVAYGARPASRLFLHALTLRFPHPENGAWMRVEAEPPLAFLHEWDGLHSALRLNTEL